MVDSVSSRQIQVNTLQGVAPGATASKTSASKVSQQSVDHLKQVEANEDGGGFGKTLRNAAATALLGASLVSVAMPAHADTTVTVAPQTSSVFLDSSNLEKTRFGDTNYAKLFGTEAGASVQVRAASVDAGTKVAFDTFNTRLAQILQRDAGSLAAGLQPITNGDALTPDQQSNMKRAFTDLVQNVPIGAFAPEVQNGLESILGKLGNNQDLSTTTLKQFGKLGGDAAGKLAKDAIGDFKDDHPAAFWSLATAGASAAVVIGYTQGTDALAKLGIKPEVKTKLFGDVKLKLGVEAGKQFSNPAATIGLDGRHTFDNGTQIRGGVSAQLHGKAFVGATIDAGVTTTTGFNADAQVRLDGSGKPYDARLSATQQFQTSGGQTGALFMNGTWSNGTNGTVAQSTIAAGAAWQDGRWTSSISGNYDLQSGRASTSLSTGRTFDINTKNDLELQIRGSVDNRGNGYVGAGVTFRF